MYLLDITDQGDLVSEDAGVFVSEASSLRLPPGIFPRVVRYRGLEFHYHDTDMTDGRDDVAGLRYRWEDDYGMKPTLEFLIIND